MKREITNIIKYLIVFGVLVVLPASIIVICELLRDRQQGGSMTSDDIWETPFMTTGIMLGFVLVIACFLWRRWASLKLGRIKQSDIWMVILMSVVLFIGWFLPENFLMGIIDIPSGLSDDEFDNMTGGVIGTFDTIVTGPIAEELLCRGAILAALLKMMPRKPFFCILIQAFIFGAIHMDPNQLVFSTIYGIMLGWLCWRTKSLIPGIVVHVANNANACLLPDSVDEAIKGMGNIPQAAALIASLLVLACGLYWFHRKYPAREEQELNTADLQT